MALIFNKNQKIRSSLSGKAINFKIADFDCWIPIKFISITKNNNFKINTPDDFIFRLQKYSPNIDKNVTKPELVEIIDEYFKNKTDDNEYLKQLENNESHFSHFDITI